MSQKNGESFGTFSKIVKNTGIVFSTSLLMMAGLFNTASAYNACDPCCMDTCSEMPDFQFYVDFLYWQRSVEGEAYAATGIPDSTAQNELGKVYNGGCDFTPGFRIGAVVDLGCCDWDFFAQYTWMNPSYSEEALPGERTLIGMFRPNTEVPLSSASLKHDDHFNVLDFGMGRTFNVNECFAFRPHFGFKATWQELNKVVDYTFVTDELTTTVIRYKNSIDFNGIGLRGGFDAAWRFSPCFSLVGGMAVSAVYTDLDVLHDRQAIITTGDTTAAPLSLLYTKSTNCTVIPVLELLLGVRWDSRICDCYDVFVFVGWENQVWFNLNQSANDSIGAPLVQEVLPTTPVPINPGFIPVSGHVAMQGLTVRAGFGF